MSPDIPDGFLPCDGRLMNINGNNALFAVIGNTFGGNGFTNFALPDLRGRVPIGAGQGTDGNNYVVGQTYGASSLPYSFSSIPPHTHAFGGSVESLPSGGGNTFYNIMSPSLVLSFAVRKTGVYPTSFQSRDVSFAVGAISMFAFGRTPPSDFLTLDRAYRSLNTAAFPQLASLFVQGNSTTFSLPNFAGRTLIGVSPMYPLLTEVGNNFYPGSIDNLPTHTHACPGGFSEPAGSSVPLETFQGSVAVHVCISTTGSRKRGDPFLAEIVIGLFARGVVNCLPLNGKSVSVTQYASLFSKLNTTATNGTFLVPRANDAMLVGITDAAPLLAVRKEGGKGLLPLWQHTHEFPNVLNGTIGGFISSAAAGNGAILSLNKAPAGIFNLGQYGKFPVNIARAQSTYSCLSVATFSSASFSNSTFNPLAGAIGLESALVGTSMRYSIILSPNELSTYTDLCVGTPISRTYISRYNGAANQSVVSRPLPVAFFELTVFPERTRYTSGEPLTILVRALDSLGGQVDYNGTGTLTSSDPSALTGFPGNLTFVQGSAISYKFKLITFGQQNITFTAAGLPSVTKTLNIATSKPSVLILQVAPEFPAGVQNNEFSLIDVPFPVTVAAVDNFGQTITTFNGGVVFTSAVATSLPAPSRFIGSNRGVKTFPNIAIGATGTITVTEPSTGISATSDTILVSYPTLTHFIITGPYFGFAGTNLTFTVSEKAVNGTLVSTARNFTLTNTAASSTTTLATVGGTKDVTVELKTGGWQSVTVTATGVAQFKRSFYVFSGAANAFTLVLPKQKRQTTLAAGEWIDVPVSAVDQFGNVDPTYVGVITMTSNDPLFESNPNTPYQFQLDDAGTRVFRIRFGTVGGPYSITISDSNNPSITATVLQDVTIIQGSTTTTTDSTTTTTTVAQSTSTDSTTTVAQSTTTTTSGSTTTTTTVAQTSSTSITPVTSGPCVSLFHECTQGGVPCCSGRCRRHTHFCNSPGNETFICVVA